MYVEDGKLIESKYEMQLNKILPGDDIILKYSLIPSLKDMSYLRLNDSIGKDGKKLDTGKLNISFLWDGKFWLRKDLWASDLDYVNKDYIAYSNSHGPISFPEDLNGKVVFAKDLNILPGTLWDPNLAWTIIQISFKFFIILYLFFFRQQ